MENVKILVIGNDKINLKVIKGRLLEFGEDWLIFNMSCEEANRETNQTKYNLVIIDCNENSSLIVEKIKHLKHSQKSFNTPIIICLQENYGNLIEKALEAGALDFIFKPFKSIELFARVRTALTLSSTIDKLDKQTKVINEGQHKINDVLSGIIPKEIIQELKEFGESKPKKYRNASVLFVDLVDFTRKSRKLTPKIIIDELSEIFSEFDNIVKKNNCTRIKTMGDGYLAVSGIPKPNSDHTINMIKSAIDMRNYITERNRINYVKWDLKIGINSGEVIGSVLGNNNYLFDVFGDTVNEAARMENTCAPNQINVAEKTYLQSRHVFKYIERLPNDIKGLGVRKMFYIRSSIDTTGFNSTKKKNYIKTENLFKIS